MRYSKSMIEAVKQVGLYEMMDYAIIDGDNKIIGLYKGNMAKKQAQINLKGAEKQVQIKKPVKVIPVSNKKKGDTVIGIGEQPLTDKDRESIDEGRYIVHSKKQGKKPVGMMTIKTTIPNAKNERDAIKQAIAMSKPSGGGLKGDEITQKDIVKVVKEELNEDVKNALAGFDNRVRDAASMDRKDLIKAKELYKRKDVKGLRKHIYSLDTSPLETVMNLISIQDRPFFDKMYPNTRGGEFLARIAYDHRKLDENLDENDEKKRMKGAKLKLKMGDALDEKKQAGYIAMYGDKKVEIPLNKAKDLYQAKQIAIKMMNVPKSKQGLLSINPAYEETIKEDGHTDVSSAVRQCKTIVEDATQMMGKLQSMSGEDSLPTWWTNKLAVASNSMNKMRDYLLVPSMQNERMEKGIDKLPRQFLNPDKEVMVMKKNKVIVIDKKDQDRYTKQGWELAEVLDKEDEPKVKEVIKKLKKASDSHAGQAKDLEKAVSETTITGKDLLENKYKEEKNGAQHFSKIEEDNYVWNFVYDDFGRTKLTTEPDKATHLVYTMEGKDNPQLLKLSEKEILDYKKGENYELSKKK